MKATKELHVCLCCGTTKPEGRQFGRMIMTKIKTHSLTQSSYGCTWRLLSTKLKSVIALPRTTPASCVLSKRLSYIHNLMVAQDEAFATCFIT